MTRLLDFLNLPLHSNLEMLLLLMAGVSFTAGAITIGVVFTVAWVLAGLAGWAYVSAKEEKAENSNEKEGNNN